MRCGLLCLFVWELEACLPGKTTDSAMACVFVLVVVEGEHLTALTITYQCACSLLIRTVETMQVERISTFFKQRGDRFYPAWSFVLPTSVLRIVYSMVESVVFACITYFVVGLAPAAGRYAAHTTVCLLDLPSIHLDIRLPVIAEPACLPFWQ